MFNTCSRITFINYSVHILNVWNICQLKFLTNIGSGPYSMPKSVDIIYNCLTLVTVVSPYQPLLCITREMGNVDSCCIGESSTKPGKVITKLRQIYLQIVCKFPKISNNLCHGGEGRLWSNCGYMLYCCRHTRWSAGTWPPCPRWWWPPRCWRSRPRPASSFRGVVPLAEVWRVIFKDVEQCFHSNLNIWIPDQRHSEVFGHRLPPLGQTHHSRCWKIPYQTSKHMLHPDKQTERQNTKLGLKKVVEMTLNE